MHLRQWIGRASGGGIDGGMSVPPVTVRGKCLRRAMGGTLELHTQGSRGWMPVLLLISGTVRISTP
jgi:hypothetical protein